MLCHPLGYLQWQVTGQGAGFVRVTDRLALPWVWEVWAVGGSSADSPLEAHRLQGQASGTPGFQALPPLPPPLCLSSDPSRALSFGSSSFHDPEDEYREGSSVSLSPAHAGTVLWTSLTCLE